MLLSGVVLTVAASAALAQPAPPNAGAAPPPPAAPEPAQPPAGPQQVEPPAVVGRIAEISGAVSYKAATAAEWEKAERNWPIVAGDAIYAAADGQARLEIGGASITVRPNAVVDLAALDDRSAAVRANSGVAGIATAAGAEPFSIMTPRGSASLGPDGVYRVTSGDETTPTEIVVCRGGAVLADGRTRLAEGQMAVLSGDPASPQVQTSAATGGCDMAPVREAKLPPRVSRRMAGIRDLGERGRWSKGPSGADVWYPDDVSEDWAPYRNGRWSWVAPWGWTWVDDAPWGFAPFHYGRWSEIDGRWGWLPGEYAEHPVYAPAMVAFVEPPADAVVGGDPSLGWVPLGPDEVYRPYYWTPGLDYVRRVNGGVAGVTAATIGALIVAPMAIAAMRNRRAVTVVPVTVINGGRPIRPAILQTRPQVLASAPIRPGGRPVLPRGPGMHRIPGPVVGRVPVPPRPIPPLASRPPIARPLPGGPVPGGPAIGGPGRPPIAGPGMRPPVAPPVAGRPPVMAPGAKPPLSGPVAGRPPVGGPGAKPPIVGGPAAGRPPLAGPGGTRPPIAPIGAGAGRPGSQPGPGTRPTGPVVTRPPVAGRPPVAARPPVATRPAVVRQPAPSRPPVVRSPSAPMRPTAPVARPVPIRTAPPVARPSAPVMRPSAPAMRPAPVVRPAPARPAPAIKRP